MAGQPHVGSGVYVLLQRLVIGYRSVVVFALPPCVLGTLD